MIDASDLKFTRTHEWVRVKGRKLVVGLTDHIQDQLVDAVGLELPEPDETHYDGGDDVGMIESTGGTTDVHMPVGGTITAINARLLSDPELINTDPYGEGWIMEIKPDSMADIMDLLSIDEYEIGLPDEEEE